MTQPSRSNAAEPYPSAGTAWRMVGILLIASMFAYLDRAIITLLLPMIRADLQINDTQFSLLQGLAFVITFAIAALPMGWIADRFARNWLIAIGVAGWSAATVMCGLADTFTELFIARMGVGLGEACLAPAAVSLIADSFPRERRGLVIGVMSVGTPLGSGIAKVIGGLTLAVIGGASIVMFSVVLAPWQAVFVIVGLPGFLVALACLTIKEPPRRELSIRQHEGKTSGRFIPYLGAHGATVWLVLATYTLIVICGYSNTSWSPILFMRRFGLTPAEAGVVIGIAVLVSGVAAALVGGAMSDAFLKRYPADGRLRMVLVLAPGIVVAFAVLTFSTSFELSLAAYCAASFLTFAATSSGPAALQEIAPNNLRGRLIGLNLLVTNLLGLGVAPTLVALLTDYFFRDDMAINASLGVVTIPAALLAIVTVALALRSYRRTKEIVAQEMAPGPG